MVVDDWPSEVETACRPQSASWSASSCAPRCHHRTHATRQQVATDISTFFLWLIRSKMWSVSLLFIFISKAWSVQLDAQGPVFVHEPPQRVEFSNALGGRADCSARGLPPPRTLWTVVDVPGSAGSSSSAEPVSMVPDLRLLPPNGSLVFPPFPASKFRHDIHTAIYRCVARNAVGAIVSRDVVVRAVVSQKLEIQIYDEFVISGNTAILRCQVPEYMTDFVIVTSWVQDDKINIFPSTETGGKYAVLKTGELLVFNVGPSDAYKTFACRILNKLTGEVQSSTYAARITVTEVQEKSPPRAAVQKHTTKQARVGEDLLLPCIAQGYPIPTYRWFKDGKDQPTPVVMNERVSEIGQGLLYFAKLKQSDEGKYICWANNSIGEETIQVQLTVTAPLSVHIQPQIQVADVGKEAVINCIVNGGPVEKKIWLHNTKLLEQTERIAVTQDSVTIHYVQKEDQGMYQCFVTSEWDVAQAVAELQMGDASPELLTKFSGQTLQPGPPLSLKCTASGNPPPHFRWTLDGFPVPDNSRFMVGQYVTLNDDVVSHLNISSVKDEDGGEYACTASNNVAEITHSARINVYGVPFIRPMPRVTAVAGRALEVKCPVAGYPIEAITWEKDGMPLPVNRRQRVFPNGTLRVEQVQKQMDAGTYTCQARNKHKHTVRRDLEVQVLVPPKIMPIQSLKDVLREGMRALITCSIIEGDLPITFRFEKDGHIVEGVTRRMDEYTASLVIENISPDHAGNYTCIASNQAGTETFTVPLTVNVPPRWHVEPSDAKVAAGKDVLINCEAVGYPQPTVTWRKAIGDMPGEYKEFLFVPNANVYSNGSLKFEKVSKDNEGFYLCESKNGVGTGISKLVQLKVNVPAHFPQRQKQMQVVKGEQAHLQCTAIGDRPIDIVWKMNGHRINENNDPRFVVRDHPMEEGLMSELGITRTYRDDTGVLTCFASNAFGQDEMKTTLIVQEVPETPKNIRVNDPQSQSLQIGWTQPNAGNSPILSYIVQYKLVDEDWQHHPKKVVVTGAVTLATIQGLKPASSYHIRVFAENRLGRSEPSEAIQVTTQEESPSGPPQEVEARATSSTEIQVNWKPPRRETWNGNLLGYYIGYQEHVEGYQPNPSPTTTANYNFKTVEIGSQYDGEVTLTRLSKFTTYSIIVQAYNSRGASPASEPLVVRTKEDVPSLPPEHIQCKTLNSESLEVMWEPNPDGLHGILLGFKVTYQATDTWSDSNLSGATGVREAEPQTKVTSSVRTVINKLQKFSNYSVTVLAYTAAGDGVKSAPIYCRTEEDVPSAPSDVKAAMSSTNKMIVSWLPPLHKNGVLVCYTFYMSIIEDGKEEGTHKRILPPDTEMHETVRLQERATYQFWLTASTRMGEGETSRIATVVPTTKVPARIMSFSRDIVTPWKQNLTLPCRKVGSPVPTTTWRLRSKPIEKTNRRQTMKDGTLILADVQKSDIGNYTCFIENPHGKDEITYSITVLVPPDRPQLYVLRSTTDSLYLEWDVSDAAKTNILGYVINYKRDHGDWEEVQIGPRATSYLLGNLWCAARYQLFITAFNNIGSGLPCDIVNATTLGSVPIAPKMNQILSVNSTTVSIWLDTWQDGGCPLLYASVEYRSAHSDVWALAASSLAPTERAFTLAGLTPGEYYAIRVTAHNNAGYTAAIYNVTTSPPPGVLIPPNSGSDTATVSEVPFYYNLSVIVTVFVISTVFTISVAAVAFFRKKKMSDQQIAMMGESPSVAQIQNEQNREQQYLGIQIRDRSHSKTDGKTGKGDPYSEEICPYATFQISKPLYQETTYSGNVYSGPYSSVKGSFVYHDSKKNAENYKLKADHEYSKVRRKGGRLRDPLSESQESDNLGSTDSEVKKILSMHLPISEYDTLGSMGSDSEGEGRAEGKGSQDLLSFRHRQRGDLKSGEDDSSSSTEASQTSGRKAFQPRKAKGKGHSSMKRHVRSSSGYSSHTEETSFSVSSFNSQHGGKLSEHMHAHNADTVECDKIHGKRRASKGNVSRYSRDTSFQIDV